MIWSVSMLRKLGKLRRFTIGELLVFSQLLLFALGVRLALIFVSLPRMTHFLSWAGNRRLLQPLPIFHYCYPAKSLAQLADLAARATRSDGPCLLRSILLFWLLKARGGQPKLLIGVNKKNGNLNSHAWIELKGKVIGDATAMVRRFNILARF